MSRFEMSRRRALLDITTEGATLWERVGGAYRPLGGDESARLAQARLEKWQERAARNEPRLFEKRLSWLGTTPQKVASLLGNVSLEGSLPRWAEIFSEAMHKAETSTSDTETSSHPFGAILRPFAETGRAMLEPICRSVFTDEVLSILIDDLLGELSHISGPTLYLEFSVLRSHQESSAEEASGAPSLYDAFAAKLLEGGLWDFFSEYPVLARLLSTTVEFWARNVSELAAALDCDLEEIESVFGGNSSVGRVTSITPSLSDKHDRGRTVAILEFESGLELVYKPRDIGIEKAWFSLLEYLNERGGDFQILKVLDRAGHGWAEVARHGECRDAVEAKQFYCRAGMLLCVLYALEASDCFYENVVASGGYPVLVDMETLMHHVLRLGSDLAQAEEMADDIVFDSVFRAGFLPSWEASPDGLCVDISGLGASTGQITPYLKRRWENINTDRMLLEHEQIVVESAKHLPQLDGVSLKAAEYAEEIVSGFRRMYDLLIKHRDELLATAGPLAALGGNEIRVVFHATRIYGLLIKRLYAPRYMRSGVERSIITDFFSRFYLESREKGRLQAVLESEIDAMEGLDVPRFAVMADNYSLRLPTGKTMENAFEQTALDRVRQRFLSLSESDMDMQTEFIRASLRVSAISIRHDTAAEHAEEAQASAETLLLSADELAREAAAIGAEIESRAIFSNDGSATWIAPQLLPRASRHVLRPLRMDIYNGLGGIALFFAALERVFGTGRRTSLAALSPLRRFVSTADQSRMIREGYSLGAVTGAGSFIYALCRSARLLEEPALFEDARRAAERITAEWVAADNYFDVMSGAAGAILGLVVLHKESGDSAVLEKAIECGDHLLKKRQPAGKGAAWPAFNGRFLTGFSHGAAGIALALMRLAHATGEHRFQEAAEEAIAFENSVFDAGENNWPDFRYAEEGRPAFMTAWCHGAPGVGLARTSGLMLFDSPEVRRDIEAATRTVSRSGLGGKDGLCCGNLGLTEMLLAAAVLKADEQLEGEAIQRASAVVKRARASGGYHLSGQPGQDFFDPSFFQGLAGIGYQLLRIARPGCLPSILVLE